MKCPECNGIGKFISDKQINVVCDEPYVIYQTKISINDNDVATVKYRGYCGDLRLNRSETTLFATKEEAQTKCDELNRERIWVNINDIIIPEDFKETQPSIDKIQARLEYYKINNKFNNEIAINKVNILQDGYITYLLCKLLNIKTIKTIVEN